MKTSEHNIITIAATEGQQVAIAGGLYRIILSGEQTKGEYAIIEMTVPPGAGPVPHVHPHIEESFFVLEGTLHFRSELGSYIAEKGAMVTIPKGGMVHHFKNHSDQPAKLLCTVIPAGLDAYFVALSTYLNSIENNTAISPSDQQTAIQRIAEQHGQHLLSPDYWDQANQ